jgi:uncharacterized protein (DUF885 family)
MSPPAAAATAPGGPPDVLGPLETRVIDHVFALQPSYAVFLGLHEYDGRIPDLTKASTDRWLQGAEGLLRELAAIPDDRMSASRRLDRTLLTLLLESPRFDLLDSRDLDRNPMVYIGPLSLTAYMVRNYAPGEQRVDAMVRAMEAVPELLATARRRLEAKLPAPFVRLAESMASGIPGHFDEAEEFARQISPACGSAFTTARAPAQTALEEFRERLRGEYLTKANDAFALGPALFQKLLWVREGIRTPFAEILARGQADLERNQHRLAELAAQAHPSAPTAVATHDVLEALYRRHATAEQLVPRAQQLVEEARRFVQEKDLVTIPEPAVCRVEETPVYGRALSTASMNPPGPFDVTGDEGIYFVTPVDAAWPPERQEEWLRSLNDAMLRNITIHEVFPGHYLQFLHFRRGTASLARKVFLSASFSEGWAHYCEQLAIEAGLGAASRDAEVAQLHDALLRDCRLIASIGLHTQGWTLAQATDLFRREAHFESLPAEREAIRGTFNPEYFCYTLGKLAILAARDRFLTPKFGGSLQGFHDQLLGFGCPPVGVLDELLSGAS